MRLVFVFDHEVWSDELLESLTAAIAGDPALGSAFKCSLVLCSDLKALIEESYDQIAAFAQNI